MSGQQPGQARLDVAGDQLDGLDHAHGVACGPPVAEMVENHVCVDGKCKTD